MVDTIIVKTQGFVNGNIKEGDRHPVAIFRRLLSLYDGIDRDALRENLRYFLQAVMPVCDEYGINMCIIRTIPLSGIGLAAYCDQ